MAALPPLWLCILDNNFIIQVKLVAASRSIFGPMFSVLHTLNFFARVIWVRHGTELQLGYLQLAMLFTASKNEVEPIIEKHSKEESLWRVGAHYTSFPELVFITSRYDLRLSSCCSNPLSMQIAIQTIKQLV